MDKVKMIKDEVIRLKDCLEDSSATEDRKVAGLICLNKVLDYIATLPQE